MSGPSAGIRTPDRTTRSLVIVLVILPQFPGCLEGDRAESEPTQYVDARLSKVQEYVRVQTSA